MGNINCSKCTRCGCNRTLTHSDEISQEGSFLKNDTQLVDINPIKAKCEKIYLKEAQLTNSFNFIDYEPNMESLCNICLKRTNRHENLESSLRKTKNVPPLMIKNLSSSFEQNEHFQDIYNTLTTKRRTKSIDVTLKVYRYKYGIDKINKNDYLGRNKSVENLKSKYYIDKTITRNQPLLLSSDLSRVKRLDNMANCDNYNTSSTQSKKDEDKELKKKLFSLMKEKSIIYGSDFFHNFDFEPLVQKKNYITIKDNEPIFSSSLNKCFNLSTKEILSSHSSKSFKFQSKFCIITKVLFSIHASYEKFLMLEKPGFSISTDKITQVNLINMTNNKEEFKYLIIFYKKNNTDTEYIIFQDKTSIDKSRKLNMNSVSIIYKWFFILNYILCINKQNN